MFTGLKWYYELVLILALVLGGLFGFYKLGQKTVNSYEQFVQSKVDSGKVLGRQEIQSKWDKQKTTDSEAYAEALSKAVKAERANQAANAETDSKLQEKITSENRSLKNTIKCLQSGDCRMRVIGGTRKTVHDLVNGVPSPVGSPTFGVEASEIRFPSEIGISVIGIGSEANQAADQLRACQEIIRQDRITCGPKPEVKH